MDIHPACDFLIKSINKYFYLLDIYKTNLGKLKRLKKLYKRNEMNKRTYNDMKFLLETSNKNIIQRMRVIRNKYPMISDYLWYVCGKI